MENPENSELNNSNSHQSKMLLVIGLAVLLVLSLIANAYLFLALNVSTNVDIGAGEDYLDDKPAVNVEDEEGALMEERILASSGNYELLDTSGMGYGGYGDVYFVYEGATESESGRVRILESLTGENGGVTNSFDTVEYTDIRLSPNGNWLLVTASCWESRCYKMYDTKTGNSYWTTHARLYAGWLADGRLKTSGGCVTPRVIACAPAESLSAQEPWKMAALTSYSPLCGEPSEVSDIGGFVYPTKETYRHLDHLGQLFTAAECGDVYRVGGVDYETGMWTPGSSLRLNAVPSDAFTTLLKEIGYTCQDGEMGCLEWRLDGEVEYQKLLELKPFASQIKSDDCINCG